MVRRLLLPLVVLLLAVPAGASAEVRYAIPDGAVRFDACPVEEPCGLEYAIRYARPGDEVRLGPGTYNVLSGIDATAEGMVVHGPAPGQPATIVSTGPGRAFSITGANITFSDLIIKSSALMGQPLVALLGANDLLDRVAISAIGSGPTGIALGGGSLVRNTVMRVTGLNPGGIASAPGGGRIIGSTLILNGTNARGVFASSCFGTPAALRIVNSIVRTSGRDVEASNSCPGAAPVTVSVLASNFATASATTGGSIIAGATNQRAGREPRFVDFGAGDLRQAPDSPTIDAGRVEPDAGALDVAGHSRLTGRATDIGAYEHVVAFPGASGGGGGAVADAPVVTVPVPAGGSVPPSTEPIPGVTTPSAAASQRMRITAVRLGRSTVAVRVSATARVKIVIARQAGRRWRTVTTVRAKRRGAGPVRRSLIAHMRLRDGRYRVKVTAIGPAGTGVTTVTKRLG